MFVAVGDVDRPRARCFPGEHDLLPDWAQTCLDTRERVRLAFRSEGKPAAGERNGDVISRGQGRTAVCVSDFAGQVDCTGSGHRLTAVANAVIS